MNCFNIISGIIFDLDGLLIDTEKFQFDAWKTALSKININLEENEYYTNYAGKSGIMISKEITKNKKLKNNFTKLLEDKEEIFNELLISEDIKLMFFAKEILNYFLLKGIKIGIVTSGPKDETIKKLRKSRLYDIIIKNNILFLTRDDIKPGEEKPNPQIYLECLKILRVSPEKCLSFEDTFSGCESAVRAGLKSILIKKGVIDGSNEIHDFVFENLKDALELIQNIYTFEK